VDSVRVVHAIPGRVRLKVTGVKDNPGLAAALEERLLGVEGIHRVEVNPVTGSILLLYDPREREEVGQTLQPLFPGLELEEYQPGGASGATNGSGPPAPVGRRISGLFGSLNTGVSRVTGGIDLKVLLPVTLFLLGVRSLIVSDKLRVPMWYDLIWFSFGTFLALNPIAPASDQSSLAEI
jgi:hypothetical protein